MYDVCERLRVWYTFGIGMNPRLKRESQALLEQAQAQYEHTKEKQRLFLALSYRADSWDRDRSVIIKAECHQAGTNHRAVVTNRKGAMIVPDGVYDEYVARAKARTATKSTRSICAATA